MTKSKASFHPFAKKPTTLQPRVNLQLIQYSESSFTDPHTVVSFAEPHFDEDAYSHIGKTYEGVEPHRMGGHHVVQNEQECLHHFNPNYRDFFIVKFQRRTRLKTLCISTRFFAGNPASDLTLTIFDDLQNTEHTIMLPQLNPDDNHWLDQLDAHVTRLALSFKAGGITRVWAYGTVAKQQPPKLSWLSKDREVLFDEDDFFGGPNFALSHKADRSNKHMLGWETSRSAMGLQAIFPIQKGIVHEVIIDTYRHVNNYLRSAWVFSASFPQNVLPSKKNCPIWNVVSSDGQTYVTPNLKKFFDQQHKDKDTLPTYTIKPVAQPPWRLETTFPLTQDALHTRANLSFEATHVCVMLLPHGGLHAIKVMGTPIVP